MNNTTRDILERSGTKVAIPEKMSIDSAIETLQRVKKYEEEVTEITESFETFPWDAAIAAYKSMKEVCGWVAAEATDIKMFGMKVGEKPPRLINVPIDFGETTAVPFGEFSLPGMDGRITMGLDGSGAFYFQAVVRRKHEDTIQRILQRAKELIVTESVYRGKAFKLRFKSDDRNGDGKDTMPKFLNLQKVKPSELVFSDSVNDAIATSLFTPIEHSQECREFKIPLKRGVLLYGPYGTGKSLTAYVTAKKCIENAWTFLYCERADELAQMVKLAHQYQPAVVFCEDIDRAVAGERSVEMDDILNIIDGIESKGTELMVILTTNHVENINRALLRPGRLDAVINVLPPDAKAVERLIRIYGRKLVPENADLSEVGRILDGTIPAVVRECTERAKLSQLKMGLGEDGKLIITPSALLDAARGMQNQMDLLNRQDPKKTDGEVLAETLQSVVRHAHNGDLGEIKEQVGDIHNRVC